jgi:hypothetical protein
MFEDYRNGILNRLAKESKQMNGYAFFDEFNLKVTPLKYGQVDSLH